MSGVASASVTRRWSSGRAAPTGCTTACSTPARPRRPGRESGGSSGSRRSLRPRTMSSIDATCDAAVIGGGLLGLATAMALAVGRGRRVVVLEAEERVAAHQSGHNSGVIHSGLYYKPGSLKATLCAEGARALYRFCAEEGIAHQRVGKLVVATHPEELPRLDEMARRGEANGLAGV